MPTTKDYLQAAFTAKSNLQATLENFNVTVVSGSKLNNMVSLVGLIETGTGYCHASIVANKLQALTFSGFNFVPSSFAISSEYALGHSYSVSGSAFNVVGALSLDGLQIGTQTHTVEIILNDTVSTITVTTVLSNTNGISTLTVSLPNGYYFVGENEWAVLGNTAFDDDESEVEE